MNAGILTGACCWALMATSGWTTVILPDSLYSLWRFLTGKMNLDDAVFFFGRENDWKIKVGRFEAYDMFPLNQDTFIEYSGIQRTIFTVTVTAISI